MIEWEHGDTLWEVKMWDILVINEMFFREILWEITGDIQTIIGSNNLKNHFFHLNLGTIQTIILEILCEWDIQLVLGGALDIEALLTNIHLLGGFSPTPLKNDGVSSSWDDEIPNWMESHKIHVPVTTNQFWISIKRKHSPEDLGYFGIVTSTLTTISSVTSRRGGCISIPWAEQMTSSFLQLHSAFLMGPENNRK